MSEYTCLDNEMIAHYIVCPKVFRSKPRDPVEVNRNYSQRFAVTSADGNMEFDVFISWSSRNPQDFSIGLMYQDHLLYRVNGFHGTTRQGFYSAVHHAYPHTHTLTKEDIECSRKAKPSLVADATGEYYDLASARLFFFRHCGIMGFEKYFPDSQQLSVFDL